MRTIFTIPFAACVLLVACGGDSAPVDSGPHEAGADATTDMTGAICTGDHDCADDFFCNGVERCMPGAPGSNPRGCLPGTNPCDATQTCNEATKHCDMGGCTTDVDGDGHIAMSCGGDDCDDTDPNRYPGNPEVCDTTNHDEDCNAATFGNEDADLDGHVAVQCCNIDATSVMHCGDDCNDADPSVHPGVPEVCNMIDDNCNGMIDEMVIAAVYLDSDGDGFGDPAHTMPGCMAGVFGGMTYVTNSTDCNDHNAMIHPGALEICDNVDTDCDPTTFGMGEDDDGDGYVDVACGGNDCQDTLATVHPGASEICDGWDSDCSSTGGALPAEDADGDMHSSPSAPCGGGGYPKDDCDDTDPTVIPGSTRCLTGSTYEVCQMDGTWSISMTCVAPTAVCDGRTGMCASGACGDGTVQPPEMCDDHNAVDLDGCDDRCRTEPAAIRQIEPYSGGYSKSTRPTFRIVSTFLGGSNFEVQRAPTRSFAAPVAVPLGAVTSPPLSRESQATPTSAMPVGRYWVRVRAIAASGAVSAWSPAWSVSIGHVRDDLTGDGNADWVVGEPGCQVSGFDVGRVGVIGATSGVGAGGYSIFGDMGSATAYRIGDWVAEGDVSGDGIEDLIVAEPTGAFGGGVVDLYNGGAGGATFDTTLDQQFLPIGHLTTAGYGWGQRVAAVGDVNGDGLDDLVVGIRQATPDTVAYQAFLVLGNTGGLGGAAAIPLSHADTHVSVFAAAGGDVNGDGLSDILLTGNRSTVSGAHDVDLGVLSIIYGNAAATFDTTVDVTLQGDTSIVGNRMGQDVTAADLDRDGYADMVVSALRQDTVDGICTDPGSSDLFVFAGGASIVSTAAPIGRAMRFPGSFGCSIDAGADLDLDGYLDVVVGSPLYDTATHANAGRFSMFHGGGTWSLSWVPVWSFDGNQLDGNLGTSVAAVGPSGALTLASGGAPNENITPLCFIPPCAPTRVSAGELWVIRADGATRTLEAVATGSYADSLAGWSTVR